MENFGRQIFKANPKIYTDKVTNVIKHHINKMMPDASDEEKESVFYRSIYDYWSYGNTISEEFYYGFLSKTHAEKSEYVVMRNRVIYCDYLNDKATANKYFDNKYNTYQLLKEYFRREAILIHNEDDYENFCSFVKKHPVFVIKPVNFSIGLYISKESVSDYSNLRELFDKILLKRKSIAADNNRDILLQIHGDIDIILEELIDQAPEMAMLHPYSVNCVRITTVRLKDKIFLWYPFCKMGRNGSFIDNVGIGAGCMAGINVSEGVVETGGFDETDYFDFPLDIHPNTNIKIKGFKIPRWNEAVALAKECANKLENVNYVGWDLALTSSGWCVVEGNEYGDCVGPQIIYKKGLRKEFEQLIGWKIDKQFWWE